jgi:hypothetical protein
MIVDLKPYLATKDSGVSWMGEVPDSVKTEELLGEIIRGVSR